MTNLLDNIVIVLDRPQDPINIGAVMRAMKNMGVRRLRLVNPTPFEQADILRLAHRCEDLLAAMEIFDELDAALADAVYVVGTDARPHGDDPTTSDMRNLSAALVQRAAAGTVVLLFGSEADGLSRTGLDRCHLIASLPMNPSYPALNLAQAALLLLYEVRMAALGAAMPQTTGAPPAPHAALERLFSLAEEVLRETGFFKYNPAAAMHSLRRMAYRAELSGEEVALLMAILRQTRWSLTQKTLS
jgi:TrmH family RNA methyltransferase